MGLEPQSSLTREISLWPNFLPWSPTFQMFHHFPSSSSSQVLVLSLWWLLKTQNIALHFIGRERNQEDKTGSFIGIRHSYIKTLLSLRDFKKNLACYLQMVHWNLMSHLHQKEVKAHGSGAGSLSLSTSYREEARSAWVKCDLGGSGCNGW